MSDYYVEKNSEGAFELYNKRTIYRARISLDSPAMNVVVMDAHEKILFGRIDANFVPLKVSHAKLKKIKNVADPVRPLRAVNFVADMFKDMCTQFDKCIQIGKIRADDPYLSSLKAFKAYQDPFVEYKEFLQIYINTIAGLLKANDINIKTFEEMIEVMLPILKDSVISEPFTFTGFLKSKNCSVMSTGLAIEIAEADYINDSEKMNNFVESPNWEFFVNTCNAYGFIIDAHVPWRIIADIGTNVFLQKASEYSDVAVVDDVLYRFFKNSSHFGYSFFKQSLILLYNAVTEPYVEIQTCSTGRVKKINHIPQEMTLSLLNDLFPEEYFIQLFVKMRIYEERPDTPDYVCQKAVEKQINRYRATGNLNYLHVFLESQLNKTFDKPNSLDYDIKRENKKREKEFADGTLMNITVTDGSNDFSSY